MGRGDEDEEEAVQTKRLQRGSLLVLRWGKGRDFWDPTAEFGELTTLLLPPASQEVSLLSAVRGWRSKRETA